MTQQKNVSPVSLVKFTKKIQKTSIGRKMQAAIKSGSQRNVLLARLEFAVSLDSEGASSASIHSLEQLNLFKTSASLSTDSREDTLQSISLTINGNSRHLLLVATDYSGRNTLLVPFNSKVDPTKVSIEVYLAVIINQLRIISQKFALINSEPASFVRISEKAND